VRLEQGDVAPDTRDNHGRTTLAWATRNGYGGIVKIVLEQEDARPDTTDKDGRTSPSWAAEDGNGGIVAIPWVVRM